jgi:hypothetical protein
VLGKLLFPSHQKALYRPTPQGALFCPVDRLFELKPIAMRCKRLGGTAEGLAGLKYSRRLG